jgi:hypothetical protein
MTKYSATIFMAAILLLLWAAMMIVFKNVMPQYDFATAHIIPAVFLAFLLLFTLLSARWEKKLADDSVSLPQVFNYFLMWKMSKMLVGVVLVFCCQTFERMEFRVFLILFALFYIVFMVLETFALRGIERRYKNLETEKK